MNCLEKIAESPINKMFVSLQYNVIKIVILSSKNAQSTDI